MNSILHWFMLKFIVKMFLESAQAKHQNLSEKLIISFVKSSVMKKNVFIHFLTVQIYNFSWYNLLIYSKVCAFYND